MVFFVLFRQIPVILSQRLNIQRIFFVNINEIL